MNNYQNTITSRNVINSDSCIIPSNMLTEDEVKELMNNHPVANYREKLKELQEKELATIMQEKENE